MSSQNLLIAVIAALVVLAFVAYLVRDRLNLFSLKWGNKEAKIGANNRGPGVKLSGVEARQNVSAVDETGSGVEADKVKAGGDATFRNEGPRKNG
jgi:hypothetical protein